MSACATLSTRGPFWHLVIPVLLVGCDGFGVDAGLGGGMGPAESPPVVVAGADCLSTRDCPPDQLCVERRCRYARTAVQGELLAAAAADQLEAGDSRGAYETFAAALRVYEQTNTPVPPEVLCKSAEAALACSIDDVPRELSARRADACFRGSLPNDPVRGNVVRRVVDLRYEGLELSAFDEAQAPAQFFTAPRSRPELGSVQVEVELVGPTGAGGDDVRGNLESPPLRQALAGCFLQDWDLHHQRATEARLPISVSSRLRDMGDYDVYEGRVQLNRTGLPGQGFAPCAAAAIEGAFAEPFRTRRIVPWEAALRVQASVR